MGADGPDGEGRLGRVGAVLAVVTQGQVTLNLESSDSW